jgi:hypothetical protein
MVIDRQGSVRSFFWDKDRFILTPFSKGKYSTGRLLGLPVSGSGIPWTLQLQSALAQMHTS